PYYERELSFLRRYSHEFARRYPKIAARLAMTGEHCDDPHVERMIESFALLGARINKKLDDDYPEFTEALVDVLYPHYLRSFPSCSIAQFRISEARYSSIAAAPAATVLPGNATGVISITFESMAPQFDLAGLKLPTLRAHLHGEQSFVAALADCLFINT
uniref:type VI secretion system baseplate subunit TssF n=1 Tax=Burkholderia cepacia TaxID=292 RepID=UPI001589C7B7